MHLRAFDQDYLTVERGTIPGYLPKHHLAAFHDGPSRSHLYGNKNDAMGQWVELIGAAAGAYGASESGDDSGAPEGGPAAGGATTGMQQPGETSAIAVSPTFQTQISPQISPVFSQMQDSAGATQAATTTQYQPGGMTAEGGGATAVPPPPMGFPPQPYGSSFPDFGSMPPTKYGGLPVSPLDPVQFTDIRSFPDAGSMIRDIQESQGFNWTPVYWIGGAAVVGVLALAFLKQRSPGPARKAA